MRAGTLEQRAVTRARIVLLAAVATGRITHEARERHTGADFLAFLKRLARADPKSEVHLILDVVSTQKTRR